ncbi:hypothetical protein ACIP6P_10550 [Streptomyces sp. NPDC088729]|uniref:hypothetical protein n=1 Tax=Streptomyces sp. NPDC088729 TaxID=3365876 RepID=UPI00380E2B05
MTEQSLNAARLLPWDGREGQPCYVVGDGTGRVSRAADTVEAVQLGMALDLIDHAEDMLDDDRCTEVQFRHVTTALTQSLREVHRVARSRGLRLGVPDRSGVEHPTGPGLVRLRP